MPLQDRSGLRAVEGVPTLSELLAEGVPGVFFVRESELLSGFQRQLYMSGLVALEVGPDGVPTQAYRLLPPPEPEEVAV